MLALERPRSTWLRKLSLRPERDAIARSVRRRNRRSSRSRSPTSASAETSGALYGIQISFRNTLLIEPSSSQNAP